MAIDATISGATADSYVTLAEYQAYGAAMGWTLGADDAADEINLRRGAVHIDTGYQHQGIRTTSTQARAYPRVMGIRVDGWSVSSETIPQNIKDAQCEAAYAIQAGADPLATVEAPISRETETVGPLSTTIEYIGGKTTTTITAVSRLLSPYLTGGPGQVKLVRA